MTAYISKCGYCRETQFTQWYSRRAPRDGYGRVDRDYMDSRPVAYCSEEHRDAADALLDQADASSEPIRDLETAVRELGALPMPVGPEPQAPRSVTLTEEQIEKLTAAGNRAVNDLVHDDLCACDAWPDRCLSSGGFFQGYWDWGYLETAVRAVLGMWESVRAGDRVTELEAELHTAEAHGRTLLEQRNAHAVELLKLRAVLREATEQIARSESDLGEATARVAELEAAQGTVYRASHDSIQMGLYRTREAAYAHCEAHELRDDAVSPMAWDVDEDGVAELVRIRIPRSPGAESPTGFVVTPLEVAAEYDAEADE
ncbi:hypothetical protein [Streptomyces sp. NPDC003730]